MEASWVSYFTLTVVDNSVWFSKFTDMAVALWRLVFSQREPPILSRWLHFLQTSADGHLISNGGGPIVRSIQEDAWNMFLHFCHTCGHDLSAYTEDDAWPSLFGRCFI